MTDPLRPCQWSEAVTFGVRMAPDGEPGRWVARRRFFKRGAGTPYRKLQSIKFLLTRDRRAVLDFLAARYPFDFPLRRRLRMLQRFTHVTNHVRGYHTLAEILTVCDAIFMRADRPDLVVIEAGTGYGSSTVKLSIATQIAGGRLMAFDSFRGIPDNDETHHLLDGRPLKFKRGAFKGRIAAVRKKLDTYGEPGVVTLTKGLFQDTLPEVRGHADVILLDVDLISSTRTCIEQLYPRLTPSGVLFSQDGHIRETIELFEDEAYWRQVIGRTPPRMEFVVEGKFVRLTPRSGDAALGTAAGREERGGAPDGQHQLDDATRPEHLADEAPE